MTRLLNHKNLKKILPNYENLKKIHFNFSRSENFPSSPQKENVKHQKLNMKSLREKAKINISYPLKKKKKYVRSLWSNETFPCGQEWPIKINLNRVSFLHFERYGIINMNADPFTSDTSVLKKKIRGLYLRGYFAKFFYLLRCLFLSRDGQESGAFFLPLREPRSINSPRNVVVSVIWTRSKFI